MDARTRHREQSRLARIAARERPAEPPAASVASAPAPARPPDPRAWRNAMLFMSALLGFFALFATWAASPTVYTCRRAEVGATCVVESRMAGLVVLDRREVARVFGAGDASSTETTTSRVKRHDRTTSTTIHTFSLLDRNGGTLYDDTTTSTPIGASPAALGAAIRALADGTRTAPVRAWRLGWPPLLAASVLWPIVAAMLIDGFRGGRAAGPPRRAWVVAWLALGAVLLAGVWTLALMGRYPDLIAVALGLPGG